MYDEELDMALEDAYDDGYYQALADMGYELDAEVMEDTELDMFDDDYFEEAVEGNPINKAKKKVWEYEKSGADTGVVPDSASKIRQFRERNYNYGLDPRNHRAYRYRKPNGNINGGSKVDTATRDVLLADNGGRPGGYWHNGELKYDTYKTRYINARKDIERRNILNRNKHEFYNKSLPPKLRKNESPYNTPVTHKNILHEMNHPSK